MLTALLVMAALHADGPKLLDDPRRIYRDHRGVLFIHADQNARFIQVSRAGFSGGFNVDYFCKYIKPLKADAEHAPFYRCEIGLFIVPDPNPPPGSSVDHLGPHKARACDAFGVCGEWWDEQRITCVDDGHGRGCPCYIFQPEGTAVSDQCEYP